MWSIDAVRNGRDGSAMYRPERTAKMSLASLARAAGVTWLESNSRSPIVNRSLVLADVSMMSTRPCRTIWRICLRYSASVRMRTSPACISGERPGAPMPNAMSASLASARMKSLAPDGSAWMEASLRSRDFSMEEELEFENWKLQIANCGARMSYLKLQFAISN